MPEIVHKENNGIREAKVMAAAIVAPQGVFFWGIKHKIFANKHLCICHTR